MASLDLETMVEIARLIFDELPDELDEESKKEIAAEIAVMVSEDEHDA
jgi:hypothetical protein